MAGLLCLCLKNFIKGAFPESYFGICFSVNLPDVSANAIGIGLEFNLRK